MGSRAAATAIMWIVYATILGIAMGEMGNWAILLAFVMMMPLIPIMGLMWNAKGASSESRKSESAKRKRDRIDQFVHDMTDEDLLHLKQRLSNHDDEDDLAYALGDDGEIVMMNEKKRR
jgi:hypothetical protein